MKELEPQVVELPGDVLSSPQVVACRDRPTITQKFPDNLPAELNLVLGQTGNAYAIMKDAGNPYVLAVGSKQLNNLIRVNAQRHNINLRQADIRDINHSLQAHAESAGICREVWYRTAPIEGGIEIDLGDSKHTHVRITAGEVEIVKEDSTTLFFRTPSTLPMSMPAEVSE
ncbi:hypothetical protein P9J64_15135 [Deltaproteobacteria bacterium IMCC39524]|nr:hypothetical protein [Deltaproteobacteria bacterium IMCC39524]